MWPRSPRRNLFAIWELPHLDTVLSSSLGKSFIPLDRLRSFVISQILLPGSGLEPPLIVEPCCSLCGSPGWGSTFTLCSPSSYPDGIPCPSLEDNPLHSSLELRATPAAVCVVLLSVHPAPICIATDANLLGLEGAHTWEFC